MLVNQEKLNRLFSVAAALNAETDGLNEAIAALEGQIKEKNLGVAAWVDLSLPSEGEPSPEALFVGYCKRDEWGFYVRHGATFTRLRDSPRVIRIKAVGAFGALIDELSRKAEEYIENVKVAYEKLKRV